MVKKIFVLLVALIGFGIAVKAQTYSKGTVTTEEKNGKFYINVPVSVSGVTISSGYTHCYVEIKVCPTTRNILDALYINCEYATIKVDRSGGGRTTVTFSCDIKQNASAPRCGAYDFEIEEQRNDCK